MTRCQRPRLSLRSTRTYTACEGWTLPLSAATPPALTCFVVADAARIGMTWTTVEGETAPSMLARMRPARIQRWRALHAPSRPVVVRSIVTHVPFVPIFWSATRMFAAGVPSALVATPLKTASLP